MRACVCACVFFIDGQSFEPFSMRFKTWVPLISRRVKVKFLRKKSDPPPSQIRLNFAKFNRNSFVSSFLDFAMVSLHLTALTVAGQMLQIPCLERPTTPILHRPRTNAVYVRPRYPISEPANQHFARINQISSCLVSMRSSQCEADCYG